jgi:hypothetical protein
MGGTADVRGLYVERQLNVGSLDDQRPRVRRQSL